MKSLDEAIKHAMEAASSLEQDAERWERADNLWGYDNSYASKEAESCRKCAAEHRQLADWLKLLKRILESGDCNECGIQKVCNVRPEWGEQVRYNCPLFVEKGER